MSQDKKILPKFAGEAKRAVSAGSRSGTNSSSFSLSSDIGGELINLKNGVSPFRYENGDVDVKDAIILSRKAYWNVSIYKLTIDIMTEFANSPIHFVGKNKSSLEFFKAWYKKINGWKLADQFFRELFRSSNIFMMRVNGTMRRKASGPVKIPVRYLMLDPAEIRASSAVSFVDGSYKKVLNEFESQVLKNSKDPKNIEFLKSLPDEVQKQIKSGRPANIPLDPDSVLPVFFKKQDYEPLSVPMYFPVLFDINLKLEFKKAEQIIARACEYMILLITVGDKDIGVDQDLVDYIQDLFSKESVGRVLVSDWTTNMDFVMPDLEKILGPAKYEAVNKDISSGLMNIFFGESKYADSMAKIKIFLERLKEARRVYINDFLLPEMESVCETMGFRECPEPVFEDVDLKDEIEYMKIYNRLAELGFLTDEETIKAHKTHILPEKYDSLVSQDQFKKEKDKGLYEPIGMGSSDAAQQPSGRPTGTPQKQKDKKVTPVGEGSFSTEKMRDAVLGMSKFIKEVESGYRSRFNIKRMSKKYKGMAKNTAYHIIQNEKQDNWSDNIEEYMSDPSKQGPIFDEVVTMADQHGVDFMAGAILYHSKIPAKA